MSSVEFAQFALREGVAPPSLGSVKERLRVATRTLLKRDNQRASHGRKPQWTANRVKDLWYADPRVSPNADQIRDLEELTGLRYGREELRKIDDIITRADAFLDGPDPDFYRPFVAALRAFNSALDRSRTER